MSLGENISDVADNSDNEVKDRAKEEVDKEEGRSKKIDNDIKEQDKNQRKTYAERIFLIITIWLIFVLVIFVLIGFDVLHYTDTVVITFLTTTTINVIGIFLIVARYLFPPKN